MYNLLRSDLPWQADLCQRLTVLQDSCKMHLCSIFCFLEAVFLVVHIFSYDITYDFIIWSENTVWNREYMQGIFWFVTILSNLVDVFIRYNFLRIMTRTSCLWTAKYIFLIFIREKRKSFWFFIRHFVVLPAKKHPLLDYFWDISRDREML